MKIYIYITALAALLLGACGGSKPAAPDSPYRRPPVKEVTAEQLALDGMLIDAVALQESGRQAEALDAFAAITRQDPQCAAAWYEMSQLLVQRRWTDSAMACARRAVGLTPDNTWYLLALAQAQSLAGDRRGLTATWERLIELKPDVLDYYYELSNAHVAAGDLAAAVEALNRVERMIGVTEPISLQKQRLWQAAGKEDKALREVERLAEAFPDDKRINATLAESHMRQKRYAKAKQCYDRILASNPDDPYIHLQLAEYYKAIGQLDQADAELLLAFERKELDSKMKLQFLNGFYTPEEIFGSRSQTAFRLVDMAMADCQDSADLAGYYGNTLMYRQMYPQAAEWFQLALQRDSASYDLWERLLVCLTETPGSDSLIAGYARRAAALFPTHTLPRFLLARSAYDEKRYDDAVAALDEVINWGFSKGYLEGETYALLAESAYRAGQYDKAWRAFDRYLELHPDDMGMLNNYAYYLAERGRQLEKALEMSRRTIEAEPDNANSLDTYGWILHLMGRHAEALPYLQRAVKLDPSSDTLRRHLQLIQEKL